MICTIERGFALWQTRLLLLGRRRAALQRVTRRLERHPNDLYALATRAHLRAEWGDKPAA